MCEQQFTSDLIKQFQRRRYDLGLTQHAMDSMLGVSPGVVAKWEIGMHIAGLKPLDAV